MSYKGRMIAAAALAAVLVAAGQAAAQTTVTMWSFLDPAKNTPRERVLRELIEEFEKRNPDDQDPRRAAGVAPDRE